MNSFKLYQELILDIEVLKELIDVYESEKASWWGGKLGKIVSLDQAAERVDNINDKLDILHEELNKKMFAKERIEGNLRKFKNIEHKVFYMRYIEGKKLQQIADELNFTHQYIKEISQRIKKLG